MITSPPAPHPAIRGIGSELSVGRGGSTLRRGVWVVLGDAPRDSEAVGEEVLVGVVEGEPVSDGVGGADPV